MVKAASLSWRGFDLFSDAAEQVEQKVCAVSAVFLFVERCVGNPSLQCFINGVSKEQRYLTLVAVSS